MSLTSDALKKLQEAALDHQNPPATEDGATGSDEFAADANRPENLSTNTAEPSPSKNDSGMNPSDVSVTSDPAQNDPSVHTSTEATTTKSEPEEADTQIEIHDGPAAPCDTLMAEAWQELAALADVKSLETELRDAVPWREAAPQIVAEPESPQTREDATGEAESDPPLDADQPANTPLNDVATPIDNSFVYLDQAERSNRVGASSSEDPPESLNDQPVDCDSPAHEDLYDPIIPTVDDLLMDEMVDAAEAASAEPVQPFEFDELHVHDDLPSDARDADDTSVAPLAELVDTSPWVEPSDEYKAADPESENAKFNVGSESDRDGDLVAEEPAAIETINESRSEPAATAHGVSDDSDTISLSDLGASPSIAAKSSIEPTAGERDFYQAQITGAAQSAPSSSAAAKRRWYEHLTALVASSETGDSASQLLENLESSCGGQLPKVLLVTALAPTSCATDVLGLLALELGERRMKVLLVDANLQDQSLTRSIEMLGLLGFCDVLVESSTESKVIRPTELPGVDVVPCGDDVTGISRDPTQLSESRLIQALRSWQDQYDRVLIDGGGQTASLFAPLARNCQATLLVISHDHANLDTIRKASAALEQVDANVAGCVLTGFPDA